VEEEEEEEVEVEEVEEEEEEQEASGLAVLMPIQAAAESAPVCLAASDSASSCGGWSSAALGL